MILDGYYQLGDWRKFKIFGTDSENFLNGQLTENVETQNTNSGYLTCRLDRTGRIKFILVLIKIDSYFYALIPSYFKENFKEDLEKYIVSEDVSIEEFSDELYLNFNPSNKTDTNIMVHVFSALSFLSKIPMGIKISENSFSNYLNLNGFFPNFISYQGRLFNETIFNILTTCYVKGCFLGQEVVRKIQSHNGAAKFPHFFKLGIREFGLSRSKLFKDNVELVNTNFIGSVYENNIMNIFFEIDRKSNDEGLTLKYADKSSNLEATVFKFDGTEESKLKYSQEIFDSVIDKYNQKHDDDALAWAQYGLEINSNSIDLLEVCGVLLARKGEKKEAIILMDRIIKINSRYVMAYTNKSIFLAELGQIEEAEKVKSLGIMASIEESISSEIKDDNSSRLRMFQEVLEIDLNDLNSNLELAKHYLDIDVIKTEKYLNNINIESAEKYLLLAQLNYRIGSIDKVKECLVSGMEVAKRSSQKNIISKIEKYSESINIY